MERLEPAEPPLRGEVRRPAAWSGDVVLLLPGPSFPGPPLAALISATLDEGQIRGVGDRGATEQVAADVGAVTWPFVVVGEATSRRADRARTGGHLDHLEAGERRIRRAGQRTPLGEFVVAQAGQLKRLEHRLVVLVLVTEHHLVEHSVAHTPLVDYLERASAGLLEVLARL